MDFLPAAFRPGRDRVASVEDGLSGTTFLQPPSGRRPTIVPPEDQLGTFRHMVGIHSTRSLGSSLPEKSQGLHNNLHFDGRTAPNLGIYNRVVHREQIAKRAYKFASIGINSCLGIQIIVAAALTAMGAANSGHTAITAFGAINTVIAGLLTYLKGSGLPNRLRFYENEWKKVREYIEQRERDFSRPDCTLDVHEIVKVVESMYEEVKADVQTNTPDNYISVGDMRNRSAFTNPVPRLSSTASHVPRLSSMLPSSLGQYGDKIKELETKYGDRIHDFVDDLAHKHDHMRKLEKGLERDLETGKSRVMEEGRDIEKEIEGRRSRIVDFGRDVEMEAEAYRSNATRAAKDLEKDMQMHGQRTKDITREGMEAQERNLEDTTRDFEAFGQKLSHNAEWPPHHRT
ncbi:hypothetical protein K469DRAFT_713941 [Zopfia rhizophila CBS 207.26]|uniref:SMODS and SLOG-associating 2TM effector domain-containing protein n=1 Tax=Zopfia rhizophila CBS 207.26 TaxID=1314779 RepID=A0A6A6DS56_9PEZI|nr:hypothetical protein K469DRAFT_713941 [Zopfia rhizophila CBS 207.26]